MHLKRNDMPKSWPLARKGTTYVVRPMNMKIGVPVLIALRDMLEVAENRKEAEQIINNGKVQLNNKKVQSVKLAVGLFDNLKLDNKNYKLVLKNRKFKLEESHDENKIIKVIGKKMLKGKKLQINLNDGRNFITKEKVNTGDSVLLNTKENKIEKILELKEHANVMFISGKHIGEYGKIEKIEGSRIIVKAEEKINSNIENLMVVI